ncbi:UDP-glucose 4-epimerase GalE [Rhodothalassium salexigens]|uniref:UDP-glucose 4-epimerase n=1 Tax=Rhodothalassium salexigens DSM 2132 TaxID=1188247 RepID=A0A4R2PJW7_RHOSA|nr:UDP-glucose 4-epimerase GalE [Rhodothalassium salexigens]MBB4211567.1 UDP-glucose 4-epimerase [Rhodothalassium salexigens DSM 2132]MBK1638413.1 UDP-glucose 4-epimerase GalE [Rhodothalassium salexigens DSM 2132]MBK5910933.1 UDP-glucose 4-epimerase GalE [Rhodothalassium salexigens]TCP34501.1 UDP-galactose 4-epimerase [Rhodothalassium salexigens DSM 2132]
MSNKSSSLPPVLVTGGAGYIGSHVVLSLLDRGRDVIVIDNLDSGHRDAVPAPAHLEVADIADQERIAKLVTEHRVREVIHLAGSVRVEESVADPLKYYLNNTAKSRSFIAACVAGGVRRFIFSSTAATYGIPAHIPVDERAAVQPINPYGWSKLMTEQMLRDTAQAVPAFDVAILRYFNVAGAEGQGRAGQRTRNATHLIHVVSQVATGKRDHLEIFGTDYDTPDGTCVRDFIHVMDLADIHAMMLDTLSDDAQRARVFNCGYGNGYSVRDVVRAAERVTDRRIPVKTGQRRPGDPPALIACSSQLRRATGWSPRLADLDTIIASSIAWEERFAD